MATFYSNLRTNDRTTPPTKNGVNVQGGRVRYIRASYTVPASAGPQIADVIEWAAIPKGATVLPNSRLYWSTGAASSTLTVGDSGTANRHLAATAVTTAGSATADNQSASGAAYTSTAETMITSTVAGAALQAAQVITLHLLYTID